MKRKLNLNINNTFRSANINFLNDEDYIPYTRDNQEYDVEKSYIIYADKIQFNTLEKLCKELYNYIIVTKKPLPSYLLFDIGNNNGASILFQIEHWEDIEKFIKNIELCSKVVSCGVLYNVHKAINVTKLLFNIYKLKYIVDRLVINCKSTDLKLKIYHMVYEVLARWRIQLWFECSNEDEIEYLDTHYTEYE